MFLSIIDKLREAVGMYPDKVAIIDNEDKYTYTSLWQEIVACNAYLIKKGLLPGDRVALLLDNSFEYITSYYGVLAVGGVVVALNTSSKSSDVINWLDNSGANILITESKYSDLYNEVIDSCKSLDVINLDLMHRHDELLVWSGSMGIHNADIYHSPEIFQETNAAIIYTSGTTGKPKGVTLSHGNFIANFTEVINYLELTKNDSIVNILPFYYSYGNSILHTHLMSGATIILENSFMYPAKTLSKIIDNNVTGFSGVPATYAILLNRVNLDDYDLGCLRYVTQAGGAMPQAHIHKLISKLPHVKLFIMYGQTEATARLTYLDPEKLIDKLGSVGKPLHGIDLQIRDENNNKLGSSETGEIYVSGPNIMNGYWNNQQLTNEVLIDNYIKTGDLGFIDEEGYVFLTGRRSDMIKVGGNRISPLEIEEVINQLDGIVEVAATGVDDEILGQVIKLTVVLNDKSTINEKEIKAFCRKKLALYKIPKYINFVEALPKTASGKIQRYLL